MARTARGSGTASRQSESSPDRGRAGRRVSEPTRFPGAEAEIVRMENGFELILLADHGAPVCSVQGWVRTGSILEGRFRGSGISHLVEHLVFKGSANRTGNALARDVQEAGGYINAYTSFDRTVYWIDAPMDGVAVAIDVVADLVSAAAFPADEFEREKDVIRREIDMGRDDPGRTASHLLFGTAFREHPFREPVIGHLELFNRLTLEDVLDYYRERYVPNNMFMVVAGDIDPNAVIDLVRGRFAGLQRGRVDGFFVPPEPPQLGMREAHEEFPTELTKFHLGWRIPGVTHADMPALDVLAHVLGGGRSSRLFRQVREEASLVHSIGAYAYTPSSEGLFIVSGDCDPDQRDEAVRLALDVIAGVAQNGIEERELEKARKATLAAQLETLVTVRGQASDVASNWHLVRNVTFTSEYLECVNALTAEDVRSVAARYLPDHSLVCTSINPPGTSGARSAGSGRDASIARTAVGPPCVTRHRLSNGLTLLVREDRRLPLVTLNAAFLGGALHESPTKAGLTHLLARTLIKGTSSRTAEEIADAVESVGGHIGASAGNNTISVSLDLMSPDFAMGMEILGDVLTAATFPESEVAREREVQAASIRADRDHLLTVALQRLREDVFRDHPYANPRKGTLDSVATLGSSDLSDHRDRLIHAGGVVSIFGDVAVDDAIELAERHLAGLRPGAVVPPLTEPAAFAGSRSELVRDKEQAVLAVGFRIGGILSPDRWALELLDEACSDMASRLFVRIREEQGLAYYVGATRFLGRAAGAFIFYLGTSREQIDHAESELLDEIAKLARDGLDEDELQRARKTYLGKVALEQQSNGALAQACVLDELFGFGHDHYLRVRDEIESTDHAAVRDACSRYLATPAALVRIVPGDSKSPSPDGPAALA